MVDAQISFNLFDGAVIAILALCALLSLFRGFIREVLSLFAWAGAAIFTLYGAEKATALLKPTLKSDTAATIVGVLACYFGALIVISIVNAILLRYIKPGKEVGGIDNLLGLVFGLAKGSLIVIMGFFILTLVSNEETYPDVVKQAWSRKYVEAATKAAVPLMPKYLSELSSLSSKDGQPGIDASAGDGNDVILEKPGDGDGGSRGLSPEALKRLLGGGGESTDGDDSTTRP